MNIVQAAASTAGVVGGALTITGLELSPVIFGASLGFTIAGAVVRIGTAGTDIGVGVDHSK